MAEGKRPLVEAAKEPANIVGLAAAVGIGIWLSPFLIIAAVVAEGVYLVSIPRSNWYLRRLHSRFDGDILKQRARLKAQVFPKIRPEVQTRFDHLEDSRKNMVAQVPSNQAWFLEVLRKLDYLLDKFLDFAAKEAEFRGYLRSVLDETLREKQESAAQTQGGGFVKSHSQRVQWAGEPASDPAEKWVGAAVSQVQDHYDAEIQDLNAQRTADTEDLTTNAVLDKRAEIIRRRRDYVGQIGKIAINLNHQMELMEDTFGLISDEVRARTPEQILADIDEVIGKTDALAEMLQDISPTVPGEASAELRAGA